MYAPVSTNGIHGLGILSPLAGVRPYSPVNGYLRQLADTTIVRDREKEGHRASLETLKHWLSCHFGDEAFAIQVFGSYDRETYLPRRYDPKSDIDVMVEFAPGCQPQAYLNRLKGFVEHYYPRSLCRQSSPAIVLQMQHLTVELVPAVFSFEYGFPLYIPDKSQGYQNWQRASEALGAARLTQANQLRNNLVKPLVRIMKYWNCRHGKPFTSFSIERNLVAFAEQNAFSSLEEGFMAYVDALPFYWPDSACQSALDDVKSLVYLMRLYAGDPQQARQILEDFLPLR